MTLEPCEIKAFLLCTVSAIEYIQDKKLLLVPMVTDGQLMVFQVQ